jgi:hypothetical protein
MIPIKVGQCIERTSRANALSKFLVLFLGNPYKAMQVR